MRGVVGILCKISSHIPSYLAQLLPVLCDGQCQVGQVVHQVPQALVILLPRVRLAPRKYALSELKLIVTYFHNF